MACSSDLYEDVAHVYIELIRNFSNEAAEDLEQIHRLCGSHAALRAGLVLTLFKIEVLQNEWVPSITIYAHLLEEYPEAIPYQVHAMAACLESWGTVPVTTTDWTSGATTANAMLLAVDQVRA